MSFAFKREKSKPDTVKFIQKEPPTNLWLNQWTILNKDFGFHWLEQEAEIKKEYTRCRTS